MYNVIVVTHLKQPNTLQWKQIAVEFHQIWNFPNCTGATNGKHIAIQAPNNSGSLFFNYKHFHSIILMAVCDARYNFTLIDLGAYGREGDASVFNLSRLSSCLDNGSLGFPPCAKLPHSNNILPYFFVGDEAFPAKPTLVRPFPGRRTGCLPLKMNVFNYR